MLQNKTDREFPIDRVLQFDAVTNSFIWFIPKNENFIKAIKNIKSAKWNGKTWVTSLESMRMSLRLAQGFNFVFAPSVKIAEENYFHFLSTFKTADCRVETSPSEIKIFALAPSTPILEAVLSELKLIDGREWDKIGKHWSVPISSVRQVKQFCRRFNLDATSLEILPDADPIREISITFNGEDFEISFPNDRDLRDAVGEIPGAVEMEGGNSWRIKNSSAEYVADFAERFKGEVDEEAKDRFKTSHNQLEMIKASSALQADLEIPKINGIPVISDIFALKEYQKAGIKFCLESLGYEQNKNLFWNRKLNSIAAGVLNADDMGLGKTVQSLAVLELSGAFPAVVVAPASARLNWEAEVRQWLPHRTVEISRGMTPSPLNSDVDITIIGWGTLQGSAKVLHPNSIVFDEIHLAKNKDAARTKAAAAVSASVLSRDGVVLGLSGTPVLNRTGELESILHLLGRLDQFGGSNSFRQRYVSTDENSAELHVQLRATCMLRRTKAQALPQLGNKIQNRILMDGDPKILEEYENFKNGMIPDIAALITGAADRSDFDRKFNAQRQTFLSKLNQLKLITARAKMEEIKDFIESEFISIGKKLVVFGHHREINEWVANEFADGCIIYGGITDQQKNAAIQKFQNDPNQLVIACSIEAAGVAINLTAASNVLFIEQSWNPGKQDQASDRCHRLGQVDIVNVHTALCVNTVDEPLWRVIQSKRAIVGEILDGKSVKNSQDDDLLDILAAISGTVLPEKLSAISNDKLEILAETDLTDDEDFQSEPFVEEFRYEQLHPSPTGRTYQGVLCCAGDSTYHFSVGCPTLNFNTRTYKASQLREASETRSACKECSASVN